MRRMRFTITDICFLHLDAGDSGAWVIDNEKGRVCGHVLAWCSRNKWAYICPMQVLLEDIQHTLDAKRVELPDAAEDVIISSKEQEMEPSMELTEPQEDLVTTMVSNLRIDPSSPVDVAERSRSNMSIFQHSGGTSWAN